MSCGLHSQTDRQLSNLSPQKFEVKSGQFVNANLIRRSADQAWDPVVKISIEIPCNNFILATKDLDLKAGSPSLCNTEKETNGLRGPAAILITRSYSSPDFDLTGRAKATPVAMQVTTINPIKPPLASLCLMKAQSVCRRPIFSMSTV